MLYTARSAQYCRAGPLSVKEAQCGDTNQQAWRGTHAKLSVRGFSWQPVKLNPSQVKLPVLHPFSTSGYS